MAAALSHQDTAQLIGERLALELRRQGWTVADLIAELRKDPLSRITGHTAIYKYVRGEGESAPPVEFLQDVARVMGLRFEYLATGRGELTDEQERQRVEVELIERQAASMVDEAHARELLSSDLRYEFGRRVEPAAEALIAFHWGRVCRAADNAPELEVDIDEMRLRFTEALARPLKHLEIDSSTLTRDEAADYLSAVVGPVAQVMVRDLYRRAQEAIAEELTERKGHSTGSGLAETNNG